MEATHGCRSGHASRWIRFVSSVVDVLVRYGDVVVDAELAGAQAPQRDEIDAHESLVDAEQRVAQLAKETHHP